MKKTTKKSEKKFKVWQAIGNCPLNCCQLVRISFDFGEPVSESHYKAFFRNFIVSEIESALSKENI